MIWKQCLDEINRCAEVAVNTPGYERETVIAFAEACTEKDISIEEGIEIIRKMAEMEGRFDD